MKNRLYIFFLLFFMSLNLMYAQPYQQDVISTSEGDLKITFVKHASLVFEFQGTTIHVDPVLRMGDYSQLPKADLILITHHHGDHLDLSAIEIIQQENTRIIATEKCCEISEFLDQAVIMNDHEEQNILGLKIRSIPAYNIQHKRHNGNPFHPKGEGNGYILTFGNKNVFVAGDTENTPEMKALKDIDVAFLPMNLPYTMTPKMVADAAKAFQPAILYPYHFGKTDTHALVTLLKGEKIDVRIRKMGFQ